MDTTPAPASDTRPRSRSQTQRIPSRPTTPLRPPSRTSLRASQTTPTGGAPRHDGDFPLNSLEPAFAELSDGMADLEANFMHLQLLNESLGRFNENFAAFLYGMNMTAFCVDFPEAPIAQSFARHADTVKDQISSSALQEKSRDGPYEAEATFLTSDTSFVENPPTTSKPPSKYSSVPSSTAKSQQSVFPHRGTNARGRPTTGSGIARGVGTRGNSGLARRAGTAFGRGGGRGRGSA